MATVYRATDLSDGSPVALKQVHMQHGDEGKRFLREVQLLQALLHPGLVGYRAHGMAQDGSWFLAMEWVAGQNLADVLRERSLAVQESLELGARVADVLAVVHSAGVVHRDLKPANIMIPPEGVAQAKVVDFGVAHVSRTRFGATPLTSTGALVGTPAYLSPEQALAGRVDFRADLFALGAVLFECLTGRPAFEAPNLMALLARITLAPIEPLRALRADLPVEIEELVAALLEKAPEARPPSAESVRLQLQRLARMVSAGSIAPLARQPGVTPDEQRLISVVAATFGESRAAASPSATETWSNPIQLQQRFRTLAAQYGANLELLPGALVAVLDASNGTPRERTWRAARLALALQPELGDAALVVATGRGVLSRSSPVGHVIDLAVGTLDSAPRGCVLVDDASASLMGGRFELVAREGKWLLSHDRGEVDAEPDPLLGKAAPFVGRRRELSLLNVTHEECVGESSARGVLVTGDPGLGKSRLCREFLQELERSGQPGVVLFARGDPMRSGFAYAMLAGTLRAEAGVRDDDSVPYKREALLTRMRRVLGEPSATRAATFLGELSGIPFVPEQLPSDVASTLRAARFEPSLMNEHGRTAFVDWLGAECTRRACVVVIEDLHWGDRFTFQLVESALEALANLPLMVVALARPEVHDELPRLRESGRFTELRLSQLSRKASSDLVQAVLDDLSAERAEQLVERSGGNPFFLEELVRAAAHGSEQLPETVLGMLEMRISRLDPTARLVLRAASVFGEVFWRDGLVELLGRAPAVQELRGWLTVLGGEEIIARERTSRFSGQDAYRFRHALIREASYAMLTDEDRTGGHLLAGRWLEAAGEDNAFTLAEHFERGGARDRAARCYLQASQAALKGNDLEGAVRHADRGAACGLDAVVRGELLSSRAEAQIWMGQAALARQAALEALELLPRGSAAWCNAVGNLGDAALVLGTWDGAEHWVEALGQAVVSAPEAESSRLMALGRTAFSLAISGHVDRAERAIHLARAASQSAIACTPLAVGHLENALGMSATIAHDLYGAAVHYERAAKAFESVGAERLAGGALSNEANMYGALGAYPRAVEIFERALAAAERSRSSYARTLVQFNLGIAWSFTGRLEDAIELEHEVIREVERQGDVRLEVGARGALSDMLVRAGVLDRAEAEARRALDVAAEHKPARAAGCAALAHVLLAAGRAVEALAYTREGMSLLATTPMEEREAQLRLCHAEALLRTGAASEAKEVIEHAVGLLRADIDRIHDLDLRRSFESIPEHRRTLELHRLLSTG